MLDVSGGVQRREGTRRACEEGGELRMRPFSTVTTIVEENGEVGEGGEGEGFEVFVVVKVVWVV